MDAQQLSEIRKEKDEFFKTSPKSPLMPKQQRDFDGLNYYPFNPDLDLTIEVKQFEEKTDIQIQTSSGEPRWYRRYGEFTFDVNDEPVRLTLYQAPHGFFIPFVDGNAGEETYPAGRYLDPEHISGDTFHVDLNRVYNPYCAYSNGWSCPITPAENRINVKIEAGEKLPSKKWAV